LTTYKGDVEISCIFSKLNLDNSFWQVSFVELIGFPTTGNGQESNKIFLDYLISDINRINSIELDRQINDSDKV
jgi:hypothetical protein